MATSASSMTSSMAHVPSSTSPAEATVGECRSHPSSAVTLGDPGDHLGDDRVVSVAPRSKCVERLATGTRASDFRRRHVARWMRRGIAGCAVALVAGVLARLNGREVLGARELGRRLGRARVSPSGRPSTPVKWARDAPPRRRRSSASSRGRLRLARTGARGGCAPRRGGHASHASNWRRGVGAAPIGIADSYPTDRDRSKGILPAI